MSKKYEIQQEEEQFLIKEATAVYGHSTLVSGMAGTRRTRPYGSAAIIQILNQGLPVGELDSLRESLNIPMEKLLSLLNLSKATISRRRNAGERLDTDASDRVLRYARLMGLAVEVLESVDQARQWLNTPAVGLGGSTPLDYARTEVGAREVENLLGRIDQAVYA